MYICKHSTETNTPSISSYQEGRFHKVASTSSNQTKTMSSIAIPPTPYKRMGKTQKWIDEVLMYLRSIGLEIVQCQHTPKFGCRWKIKATCGNVGLFIKVYQRNQLDQYHKEAHALRNATFPEGVEGVKLVGNVIHEGAGILFIKDESCAMSNQVPMDNIEGLVQKFKQSNPGIELDETNQNYCPINRDGNPVLLMFDFVTKNQVIVHDDLAFINTNSMSPIKTLPLPPPSLDAENMTPPSSPVSTRRRLF